MQNNTIIKKKSFWVTGSILLAFCLLLVFTPFNLQGQDSSAGLASAADKPAATSLEDSGAEETLPAEAPAAEKELLRSLQVQVEVTNKGSSTSNNVLLRIPMLADLDSPYQHLLEEQFSHEPASLEELEMRGRVMTIEIPSLAPGRSETITLNYTVGTSSSQNSSGNAPGGLSEYLQPSPKVESDHQEIKSTARQIVEGLEEDQEKVRSIYKYVIDYLEYDLNEQYRNKGALSALRSKKGVCEEYASLFVALTRAAGIPARVVNGYTDPRGTGELWDIPQGESFSLNGYRHAWTEFYLEGEGWLPADPTMENGSSSLKYFGSLPGGSYIAQNYLDQELGARFQGGSLAVTWDEQLVN